MVAIGRLYCVNTGQCANAVLCQFINALYVYCFVYTIPHVLFLQLVMEYCLGSASDIVEGV